MKELFLSLLNNQVFLSAAGAALGGFVGVVAFFLIRFIVELCRLKPKHIQTYKCANELNQGQSNEMDGELLHHHGKRIAIGEDYKKVGARNPVWEWTKDPVGRTPIGASIIYGPYSTDPTEPGLYNATFVIKGIGFSKPAEIIKDLILLELDANKIIPGYFPSNATVAVIEQHQKMSRRFIRVSDLAKRGCWWKSGWHKFKIRFYSDGQGTWEYRIYPYSENIDQQGSNVRILFDSIIIHKTNKFLLPWA